MHTQKDTIAVIGLGYVGYPLAVALDKKNRGVIGFDINSARVTELRDGFDRTGEIDADVVAASTINVTDQVSDLSGATAYIVTVPTPVDANNQPDLNPLLGACRTLAPVLSPGNLVVFESTAYPGVTEDVCGAEIARRTGMTPADDFFLGYSPERINPLDHVNTSEQISTAAYGDST